MATTAELIIDVHHHFMPPILFDRLAAQAGGKRIVTKEISLTLHPSRKDLEAHIKCMDEAGITVAILTDQVQVMGAEVARALNDGIAEIEARDPAGGGGVGSVLPRCPELRFNMRRLGGGTSALKGRMMGFFETDDADIPPDMRGYLKTQSEQKKFGLTERFDKIFTAPYFAPPGPGAA